jgi:ornithine decarboxylase
MTPTLALAPPPPVQLTRPRLELDVAAAVSAYRGLEQALCGSTLRYAVGTDPDPVLLAALAGAGCRFDVAGPAEVTAAMLAGAAPAELVCSHPVRRREDVRFAARVGVRRFVVDSPDALATLAEEAPGAGVLVRPTTSGASAVTLLRACAELGLCADGVALHAGPEQRRPSDWAGPVAAAAEVFAAVPSAWLLDLGGGFPSTLDPASPPAWAHGAAIAAAVVTSFRRTPTLLAEPGRAIAADARVLHTRVLAVTQRDGARWVHVDAGGLVASLPHRVSTDVTGPSARCVLAGPSYDPAEVLHPAVELPLALAEGDLVRVHGTGGHVASPAPAVPPTAPARTALRRTSASAVSTTERIPITLR